MGIEGREHVEEDLLMHFPFRYDDFSQAARISPEHIGQTITIEGVVTKTNLARVFRRKLTIAEISVEDENHIPLKAVWFNQPFILDSLKEGTSVRLSGKLILKGKVLQMSNPSWERASRETTNTGRLVPVYSETRGLTSKWIRWQLKPLLEIAKQLEDIVPNEIRKRLNLYEIYTALLQQDRHQSWRQARQRRRGGEEVTGARFRAGRAQGRRQAAFTQVRSR